MNEMMRGIDLLKNNSYFQDCLEEFCVKILLNSISTGSHILIGKVYQNLMIDVRISNVKLYWRAVSIIENVCDLEKKEGEEGGEMYLLKSILNGIDNKNNLTINDLISIATKSELIVPKAIIMAKKGCSSKEAQQLLAKNNCSIRECLKEII
jgi:N-acetylmuramic acid 6-phosphate (MurNAc-6-P) etherase